MTVNERVDTYITVPDRSTRAGQNALAVGEVLVGMGLSLEEPIHLFDGPLDEARDVVALVSVIGQLHQPGARLTAKGREVVRRFVNEVQPILDGADADLSASRTANPPR